MRRITRSSLLAVGAAGALAAAVAAQAGAPADKVSLCHGTASDTNPYVLIHVSENALQGHFDGTAPGHGWQNAPDFLFNPKYASCEEQAADDGGGNED
jgi:opacity protein-like surface antigen